MQYPPQQQPQFPPQQPQPYNQPNFASAGLARFRAANRAVQVGLGCGAIIVLCFCVVLSIGVLGSLNRSPSANAGSPTATTATTASGTPRPTATATHTPKWTTVQTFKGNGISKTATFTVSASQWKILWSCNPAAYGSDYNLIAELTPPGQDFGDPVVNVICSTKDPSTESGETMEYQSGTYYLDINSEASWEFQVQVLK